MSPPPRVLFEDHPAPMWLDDPGSGRVVEANRAAVSLFGHPREVLIGAPLERLGDPGACVLSAASGQLGAASVRAVSMRVRHAEGRWLDLECTCRPIDHEGRAVRLVVAYDVTGRLAEQRELNAARERAHQLGVLLTNTTAALVVIDAGAVVRYANPAVAGLLGLPEAEAGALGPGEPVRALLGQRFEVLLGDEADPGVTDEFAAAIAHGLGVVQIYRGFGRRGGASWIELRLSPVRGDDGSVTDFVGILADVSERKRFEQQLAHQGSHDALTGLPNRHLALDRLRQALHYASRLDRRVGVILLDLDEFKVLNDSVGHRAGDDLLQQVARRLRAAVRLGDTVARLGGDEFMVVCANLVDDAELDLVAARLTAAFDAPFVIGEESRYVTVSAGISAAPADGDDAEVLIKSADIAMYRAKADGRDAVRRFLPEMNEALALRYSVDARLREALERGEFVLHYQPQVDARSGRSCGVEALIRWQHPERGLVPPLQFIPAAEESGLIVPIGRWALETACRQHKRWVDAGLADFPVAVNVSVAQFRKSDLVATVAEVLAQTGLPAHLLELELTESLIIDNAEAFVAILARLVQLGVRLAIDDFGTGYSSLNYLRRLPVHRLKIDRAFVRDIHLDPSDAALGRSIIAMAHNLGLEVVAEGVETEPQAAFLRRNMCDVLQGYLYSRPQAAHDVEEMLRRNTRLAAAAPQGTDRTVLLVDDEPMVSRVVRRQLEIAGYHVIVADSGPAALVLLAGHDVGVVISDQRMPEMTGTELLTRVKDLHPETVRIILSGFAELGTLQDAINRGAIYKFLVKPCHEDVLRASVAEAFQHHAVLRENARLRRHLGEGAAP